MSKLLFGNNSVVPVKDFRTDFVPGLGIDQGNYENGTIAVDNTVIRNIATQYSGCVVTQYASSNSNYSGQTAYGHGTNTNGLRTTAYGYSAQVEGEESIAIGAKTEVIGRCGIALGSWASAKEECISIGQGANYNNNSKFGQIAIGFYSKAGIAPGSIVIGRNSVATTYNDTYNTIVIGNDHNASSAWGSVIIGGYDYTNGTQIAHEKSFSNDSVVIGLNAGGVLNGTDTACSIAIGSNATINHQHTMAIGCGAQATGWGALALGYTANSTSTRKNISEYANIAIGYQSDSQGDSNISMGFQAKNKGIGNIAIGWKAIAGTNVPGITSCNYSIAIGYAAYAVAQDSVQIGTGDNTEPMTIKYRDKKLLNADGTIPYQRFSTYTPIDGQVLSYDRNLGGLKWVDMASGGSGGGSYHLPVASSTTLGGVKIGTGLNITLDGTLSVKQDSQKTTWGTITGKLNNQTDLKNALDTKQKVMQYVEMPVATASRDGEVAQYIGEEDTLYKPGQFYQCSEDDYPTATITSDTQWANLEVDPWMFANYIAKYYYNNDLQSVPSKVYAIEYVNQYDGLGWILYENETSVYVKDIYKMGITAEGGEPELGDKVYVQLYMHSAEGYAWRKLLVDAQVSVNNTLTSTSTKQALSANQGRVLNDKIEQLSGISHFLAMWDCDTGIARYLNTGYQYESGDYFIIATVAEENVSIKAEVVSGGTIGKTVSVDLDYIEGWRDYFGDREQVVTFTMGAGQYGLDFSTDYDSKIWTKAELSSELGITTTDFNTMGDKFTVTAFFVNYKPAGTVYPGDTPASREITDDPVQISDMYFYDGAHWILLQSSARQIAVDEDLDDTSRNPVENRVVTNALAGKLDADSTEGLYATNDEGETQKLSVGSGLAINNGELVNTRTGGTWGQITGNIENQTDLVDYVASHGGGGSSLQLSDVFIKSKNLVEKDGLAEWQMNRYKGGYSDIFFKISSDYDSLKNARNDLYITIARNANTNHNRRTSKMTVLDDCNRFKTNKKFYCWKSLGSGNSIYYHNKDNVWEWTTDVNNLPDAEKYAGKVVKYSVDDVFYESIYDFDNGGWIWSAYNRQYIKETEYDYFYVEKYYADQYALQNDNPVIFTVPTLNSNLDKGSWGSNFNELYAWGSLEDYDNPGYERCPQFDIDSVVSLNSNYRKGSQYGNVVKNEFAKMECYIANTPTGKAYLWSYDWTASGEDIYAYLDESDNPLYDVPKFMGDLLQYTEYTGSSNITLIERRSDLDYYQYNGSRDGFRTVIEDLKYSTQDFPDLEGSVGQFDTSWNSYWFDYPIKPVRLADCKIYAYKLPKTFGDTDEEKTARSQKFVSLIKRAWSFEEIEADEDLKHLIMNQDDLIFVLPYDTSYIWMRLFGWQKGVHNRLGNDNTNTYAEPWDRHDFKQAILKIQSPYECYDIKMFGARRTGWTDYKGRFFQRLQFNLTTGSDLSHHKPSKLHPLSKILWVNGSGCEVKQGLIDQSK